MEHEAPDSLRAVVADRLRSEIISGHFAPGRPLREEALAAEYGASRLPVREALAQLNAEGFVSLTRYRGAAVATLRPETGLELIDIRCKLEALAASRAAQSRGGEAAEDLREVLDRGLRLAKEGSYEQLPELVSRFHELVAVASGNVELGEMLAQLRYKTSWVFHLSLPERSEANWQEHAEVLAAIEQGFSGVAAQLMEEHVRKDVAIYMDHMSKNPPHR